MAYTQFHRIKGKGGVLPHPPPKTLIEWMKFNGSRIHKILSTPSKFIQDQVQIRLEGSKILSRVIL